jgi:hypothetical protein
VNLATQVEAAWHDAANPMLISWLLGMKKFSQFGNMPHLINVLGSLKLLFSYLSILVYIAAILQ